MYCSSVSGTLNSAFGFFSALARWATRDAAEVLAGRAVRPHVGAVMKAKIEFGPPEP